ncbi:MAG: hypothetical protein ABR990_03345 [Terracidiphilus sp.]|jgi:hypothetical protein
MKDASVVERRLKILRTEVDCDFPGLVNALEKGLKVAVVTEQYQDFDFNPDGLRRIGGMAMLCIHYGAAAIFVRECDFAELNSKNAHKP